MQLPDDFFSADYSLITERNAPPKNRRPIYLAWLSSLMSAIQTSHNAIFGSDNVDGVLINNYRQKKLRERNYNSTTLVFEALLNAEFNAPLQTVTLGSGSIYIVNNGVSPIAFITDENSGLPPFMITDDPLDIANGDTPADFGEFIDFLPVYDFTVFVPTAFLAQITSDALVAKIEQYKLFATNYEIQTY